MQPNFRFPYINRMFAQYDPRFRDILLVVFGFFGVIWFFFDLGNHHPLSTVDIRFDNEKVIEKADSIFNSWEYQAVNLKKRAYIETNASLINRIQSQVGRERFFSNAKEEKAIQLPLYTWAVDEFSVKNEQVETVLSFQLSREGEVVSFEVDDELLRSQTPFNRKLLRFGLKELDGTNRQKEDSLIAKLIEFQHLRNTSLDIFELILVRGEDNLDNFAWRGADYYLANSYWKRFNFKKDSSAFEDDGVVRFAKLFYTSTDTVMGVVPKVELEVLPTGILRKMSFELSNEIPEVEFLSNTRQRTIQSILFLFLFWLLISFYLRIKARAIDTRPALVVAVITGLMVPLITILQIAKSFDLALEASAIPNLFNQILAFGVVGAVTAVAFFVATAVSDSITRQYWPQQMKTWDLVRQGMFKNKPVGWTIVRALCMGTTAVSVFTVLLSVFPNTFINGDVQFIADTYIFSPVANIIITLLTSLAIVVVTFMILGNQVYRLTSKKWLIPFVSALLFGLMDPISIDIYPEMQNMIIHGIIGYLFGIFYIRFDFVTVALGFFIYLNFLQTSHGWLVANSPDSAIFYGFIATLILLSAFALYFLLVGEDKDSLPDYVPEYIEDQAKEQRILQELDIARTVQKTFLPEKTPIVPGFDTAALCIPAQETGGDYYDIICLDDTRAAIAIGDVSGKGIQAAFYMTFAKGVIHSLCSIFPSPKMMMNRVNKLFTQNATRGTFISMIYGVLDSEKNTFTYIRAGHNPILYKQVSGEISWLQPKGVALGMAKGESFNQVSEEETIHLSKGDVLVLYTDGITEAQNEKDEFYDEIRLKKLIKREKTKTALELRNLIIEDVRTFIGEARQFDDMTLVVIKA